MRIHSRLVLSIPVMLAFALPTDVKAQSRGWGVGVGIGVGPGFGYGPYWGPGFGVYPTRFPGYYGSGLSMYGPPVPTYRPIPGVFGGGDSRFFDLPPLYRPGFFNYAYVPLHKPSALSGTVVEGTVPPALEVLPSFDAKAGPFDVEVRLPRADAKLFIDGTESKGTGKVRTFATPALAADQEVSYDLRIEWTIDGLTTTHSRKITGRAGGKVVVEVPE